MVKKSKNIIITGAASGLGLCLAKKLRASDHNLILLGRNNEQLHALSESLNGSKTYKVDLSKEEEIIKFSRDVIVKLDKLDAIINNAGVFYLESITDTALAIWDETLNVNLKAVFLLTKELLPLLYKSSHAQIINICSIAGKYGYEGNSAYSASKFGLRGLGQVMGNELYKKDILVATIFPSQINTKIWGRYPQIKKNKSNILETDEVADEIVKIIDGKYKLGRRHFLEMDISKQNNLIIKNINRL